MDLEALRCIPSLQGLSERQLVRVARELSSRDYGAGQVIARGYRLQDLLFLVEKGSVEVLSLAKGNRTPFARLRPTQFFDGGQSGIARHLPLAVQAVTPVRLLILDKRAAKSASRAVPSKTVRSPINQVLTHPSWTNFLAFCAAFALVILLLGILLLPSPWHIAADLHYGFASWLLSQGETGWAGRELGRAIVLQPDHATAYNDLGYLHYQREEWEAALEMFHAATLADPDLAVAYNNLGLTYLALERDQEALVALQRAAHLNPEDAQAFNHLGLVLQRLGRLGEAEEAFRSALRIDARLAPARANLAVLYFNQDRRAEAVQQARMALDIDASLSQMHVIIGADALARRDYAMAQDHLVKASGLPPVDPAVWLYIRLLAETQQ